MAAAMEFCLLGPLAVQRNGIQLPPLPGKLRVLLAALLFSRDHLVAQEDLSAALWGDKPPQSSRVTLRNYVKELRQALEAPGNTRISTLPGGYRIGASADELDLSRFEALRDRARQAASRRDWDQARALLGTALALWRGEPLADVPSEWLALRHVPRLTEMRLQAIEARLDAELQLGRHADVVADLRQMAALDPLRERLHALLMLALYRNGQQGEALAAYQHAREVLLTELGAEPGPELSRLQQQILTADPALAAPAGGPHRIAAHSPRSTADRPAQLPADLTDFTGRLKQTRQLAEVLKGGSGQHAPGAVAVAALTGGAGIGKTSLAVHVAHQAAAWFPDGQIYLELGGSQSKPATATEALARLLRDLGTDPQTAPASEDERAARYRSLVAGRRLLLVLDDAYDAAQVRPLLPGAAGCAVLVTSRRSLTDLESARLVDIDVLNDHDAERMFSRIVGSRAEAEPEATRRVLTTCGGWPLAIRIAAARLAARPGWSVAWLAGRLADEQRRLDVLQTGEMAVRSSFLASYESLRPGEAGAGLPADRAFRLLGLPGGSDISLSGASTLFGVSSDEAEPVLDTLLDAHLLQAAPPARYRLHDLLRTYASERALAEEPQLARDEAIRRMLQWYLHTAGAACRLVNPHRPHVALGPPQPGIVPLTFAGYREALAWLDEEHINLLRCVNQAARLGEHQIAWQLPHILWDLFNLRGHTGDWLGAHQAGLASARLLGDLEAEKRMLGSLAGNYLYIGEPAAALDCGRQILAIARKLGDTGPIAVALVNLGANLTALGRNDEAMAPLQEALGLFGQIGERNGEAYALCGIAAIHGQRGDIDESISGYRRGVAILKEITNLASAGEALAEMCELRLRPGQEHVLTAVIADATEAVELSRAAGSRRVEAAALTVLGRAYRDAGQPLRAGDCWHSALHIYNGLGHPQAARLKADLDALGTA